MKKRIQGLIAGLLLGAVLTGTTVFAANTISLHGVLMEGISIVLDGQKVNPTDVNGNKVEPLIYNGTTYLPVRAVATALGKAVYWDGPTYTVYLGDMDGKLEYPTVELRDLKSLEHDHYLETNLRDNYGNTYAYGISGVYRGLTYEYLTNMKYSKLKGTICIKENTSSNDTGSVEVIADGRRIYVSPELNKISAPISLDVNVTGYNDIKILISGKIAGSIYIADAGFYQ